ncbi:type II toxin-antitoxin system VapC family toxin [Wenzhouxiangella sp. AB-CW3]|uniref:type II toxin-antitoxin system VapC family toxin n=1 Tax=Wenzhouxiangella sp. AB-CW3 TaxID=2771012 RepID=UPI00168BFE0F|nr:type II toxin-antitoxin system VapC family toxin [Wenzhouxiangella sp. AB-CW3]QOC23768.1 type II toxin-antitoxin system VapC family toxin [Wenzhouxiangella sp. AB-CW3]
MNAVFLDASALIYLLEGEPGIQHATQKILADLCSGDAKPAIVVSALSLLECRVHPIRTGDTARLEKFDHFFVNPGLSIVELDGEVIERATRLRARHGLRTPDALQAASALTLPENPAIVTGDKDFRKIPELNVHLIE